MTKSRPKQFARWISSIVITIYKTIRRIGRAKRKESQISLKELYFESVKKCWDHLTITSNSKSCPVQQADQESFFRGEASGLKSKDLEAQLPIWIKHIDNTRPRACTDSEKKGKPFSSKEVWNEVKKGKNASSPGFDGIDYRILKSLGYYFFTWLTRSYNLMKYWKKCPAAWKNGHTTLLYKKGDEMDMGNWRPICLLSIIYKIYSVLIAQAHTGP